MQGLKGILRELVRSTIKTEKSLQTFKSIWSLEIKERARASGEQVEQSSDYRCVLVHTCTSTFILTHCFLLLPLKCSLDCLTFTFHTLTCLYFAQNRHFFMISTRLWPTDGRTDRRTDGPTDGRTHPLIEMRERI